MPAAITENLVYVGLLGYVTATGIRSKSPEAIVNISPFGCSISGDCQCSNHQSHRKDGRQKIEIHFESGPDIEDVTFTTLDMGCSVGALLMRHLWQRDDRVPNNVYDFILVIPRNVSSKLRSSDQFDP